MGRPSGGAGAAQAVPPLLSRGRLGPFGAWARRYDDNWLFVVFYIGPAIGLSLFVSLFWLVVWATIIDELRPLGPVTAGR